MDQKRPLVTLKPSQTNPPRITWAQLDLAASEDLRGLIKRQPIAAQLVLALIEKMQPGSGGVIVASRTTMAEMLDVSLSTVKRALGLLMDEGWVQRIKVGGTPALAINHRVAWVGDRGDIRHAAFGATVIASRSEQDAIALNPPPLRQIPVMRRGEMPLMVGQGLKPPSQADLDGVAPVVFEQPDPWAAERAEQRARGQLKLD